MMQFLNQTDSPVKSDALREPSAVWAALPRPLGGRAESRGFTGSWALQVEISVDEVMADLNHGRE